ncbi:hypothetical protein ACWGI0_23050 [Streptomyces sp. NPDC054802]
MIENTSETMNDPSRALGFIAASIGPGGSSEAIEEMERAGQTQLVNSDRLPTKLNGSQLEDFQALGFSFGEPDVSDPLFRPATLPEGWKRQASDHDMWSYVVDQLGRRRVGIFYKAAFYDRSAHMHLESVHNYVQQCVYDGCDIVTDDRWATPAAVVDAALAAAAMWGDDEKEQQYRAVAAKYSKADQT